MNVCRVFLPAGGHCCFAYGSAAVAPKLGGLSLKPHISCLGLYSLRFLYATALRLEPIFTPLVLYWPYHLRKVRSKPMDALYLGIGLVFFTAAWGVVVAIAHLQGGKHP